MLRFKLTSGVPEHSAAKYQVVGLNPTLWFIMECSIGRISICEEYTYPHTKNMY